jgi:hypothetical protein
VTDTDCPHCRTALAKAERHAFGFYGCDLHGPFIYDPVGRIRELEAALRALADDYEALMGDGLTVDNQPAVLAQARAALEGKEPRP